MPALLAAAVWAAAFSPAAVLFATVVARRPVLVVLVFLSAFACAYVLFLRSLRQLGVAVDTGPPAAHLLSAAVANGVGIWAAYTLVLYGDVLWRSSLPGSLYSDQCEGLSTFAVDAMSACGIGLVNVLLSCIGWEKDEPLLSSQSRAHRSSAPLDEPPPEETTRQRLNRPSAAASGD
ncbi:hypothetical protein EMIHUDRAFT_214969 [Emiliania huxleyi CCMP1516]|uniref:MARVEL domain-containing protein n=2 Tax=Emiliania huxleyi TaxID=2903 RepID=A0A0D3IIQ0_EMIH1|nr:hypothetical protein EMIHUDRAFT_214969 [Emiliania huxleyi CCMP1516]EOD11135.1 hypothetical protein EMIHUDRAFT_214969 [Emiliania huxleyi CCMP1516]|eukprot:XP_005763564.1 hypothetical protein EMIHUDRAFT_214969 [Emiliania huxleyi CCMP1516]